MKNDYFIKIFSIFKMENPVFILHPGIGIKSNLEFYGFLNKLTSCFF
jgi:hypothetical protein